MQKIIYLIDNPHNAPSAAYNRICLFEKGLKEENVNCSITLIQTIYNHRRPLRYLLVPIYLVWYYLRFFLNKNNILIVYGENYLWNLLKWPRKAVVYVERNEYPTFLIDKNVEQTQKRINQLNLLHNIEGMITCSEALRKYYSQFLNQGARIHVSNVIVDVKEFQIDCDIVKKIAYCGDWGNNKDGVDILIRAFAKFYRKYPDYTLELIGGSTPQVENELHQIAIALGVEDSINYVGRIPHSQIPKHLCSADMLALARPANKQAEGGFPSKVAEYLATGRPVVLTNVGELHLYLEDNVNCFMAEPDSVESFFEKLCEAVEHPRKEMISESGYKKSLEFDYVYKARQIKDFMFGNSGEDSPIS